MVIILTDILVEALQGIYPGHLRNFVTGNGVTLRVKKKLPSTKQDTKHYSARGAIAQFLAKDGRIEEVYIWCCQQIEVCRSINSANKKICCKRLACMIAHTYPKKGVDQWCRTIKSRLQAMLEGRGTLRQRANFERQLTSYDDTYYIHATAELLMKGIKMKEPLVKEMAYQKEVWSKTTLEYLELARSSRENIGQKTAGQLHVLGHEKVKAYVLETLRGSAGRTTTYGQYVHNRPVNVTGRKHGRSDNSSQHTIQGGAEHDVAHFVDSNPYLTQTVRYADKLGVPEGDKRALTLWFIYAAPKDNNKDFASQLQKYLHHHYSPLQHPSAYKLDLKAWLAKRRNKAKGALKNRANWEAYLDKYGRSGRIDPARKHVIMETVFAGRDQGSPLAELATSEFVGDKKALESARADAARGTFEKID